MQRADAQVRNVFSHCQTRRHLASRFATAARLYSEAVVAPTRNSAEAQGTDYDRLCGMVMDAQERAQAAGVAFQRHIELHRCVAARQDAEFVSAGLHENGTGTRKGD
jgi:hypothetical protein